MTLGATQSMKLIGPLWQKTSLDSGDVNLVNSLNSRPERKSIIPTPLTKGLSTPGCSDVKGGQLNGALFCARAD